MKQKVSIRLVVFIVIALLIVVNNTFSPVYFLSGIIQKTFVYPKVLAYDFKIRVINTFEKGNEDTEKLREENRKMLESLKDYEVLKKENEVLKRQFSNTTIKPLSLIPAKVIGFLGSYTHPNSIVIDRGEEDGVRRGTGVVFGEYLVGKIESTSKFYSQVMLPSHTHFSVVGRTLSSNATGVVKGAEDFLLFDKVLITDTLEQSDVVVTRGEVDSLGNNIYPNLIIGKIISINKVENKPFQNAKIENGIVYGKLTSVFVLKKID